MFVVRKSKSIPLSPLSRIHVDYTLTGMLLGLGLQLHLSVLAIVGTSMLILLVYGKTKWKVSFYAFRLQLQ